MCEHPEDASEPTADVVATLVANHRAFLAFVERRVRDRDVAEEILQNAFVKSVDKFEAVRETALGWFYTVLRNAIVDYRRRQAVADRRLESFAVAAETSEARDDELYGVVCACVAELARTLKPEYADALTKIEIEGVTVKDYAAQLGISSSNAGVRVFRAREALRKQLVRACGTCATHGCLDCTCSQAPAERARTCGHTH